jgi:hypothetical protein
VKRRSNGKTPLEFEVGVTTSRFFATIILRKLLAPLPMTERKYHKSEIATEQLKTAIFLFLTCRDSSSVITLAGAASNILERLVRNEGKTPFIDYARNIPNVLGGFSRLPREQKGGAKPPLSAAWAALMHDVPSAGPL